ncbi:MAG: DUF6572 domain-containing protein [Thermoanaerobaculia bacterium]
MPLEQTKTVNIGYLDSDTGTLVLTLTDAWGWSEDEERDHLPLMQDKLNSYIGAIESGEARRFLKSGQAELGGLRRRRSAVARLRDADGHQRRRLEIRRNGELSELRYVQPR